MARRTLTPATPAPTGPPAVLPHDLAKLAQSDPVWAANLQLLRRQWKWAAFSQFFYTFASLLAMNDVTLMDIEDDLARGTALFLPRVVQRLLYTLTQDRKITSDTWQVALRKQYIKRDPEADPLGPELKLPTRDPSTAPSESAPERVQEGRVAEVADSAPAISGFMAQDEHSQSGQGSVAEESRPPDVNPDSEAKSEPTDQFSVKKEDTAEPSQEAVDESKDWTELPMLVKLDTLYILTEWQFQNPNRLRTLMKDDDETALWRIEPIGYDAKTNAYWLIGPDRLWIQRVPPKPPKGTKRKRPTNKASSRSTANKADEQEYESDAQSSPKRTRVQTKASSRSSRSRAKRALSPAPETPNGRSARAAKLQANKKLDFQAKELAEFQRQAAAFATGSKSSSRATRQTRSQTDSSPTKLSKRAVLGTRTSARLRGAQTVDDEDDEWQQIPEEWLNETIPATPQRNTRNKGKGRVTEPEERSVAVEDTPDIEMPATEDLKTGLESDESVSELTELSEYAGDEAGDQDAPADEDALQDEVAPPARQTRSTRRATVGKRNAAVPETIGQELDDDVVEEPSAQEVSTEDAVVGLKLPEDLVEWETICVTLHEWEHIAEHFENATHYLEKALYKMLSQNIVPLIVTELKEAERRQKMEEAIVHRKRSSRIAIKESEKEQAVVAAKKKAEEDEKSARARRQEMRAKKEEQERAKREKAREQRRIEREEREKRAREKEERAERRAKGEEDRHSTMTPVLAGTHSTESIQLSSAPTPTGVQTPNWVLDCEICHKNGINIDDGSPMVSCGVCKRWQHKQCHDLADQRAGRPRRNWEVQQFYCYSCRLQHTNGAYGALIPQRFTPTQQYPSSSWSHAPVDPVAHVQKAGPSAYPRDTYTQSTPDLRFVPSQQSHNGVNYNHDAQARTSTPQSGYTRTQGGITFSHYQPEQRAFTTTRTTIPPQTPAQQPAWANGYPAESSRTPQPVAYAQYSRAQAFANGRMPTSYQQHTPPIPQHQPYGVSQSSPSPSTNGQWSGSPNGYFPPHDSAVRSAAESLAYMQGGANGQLLQHQHQTNGWHRAPTSPPVPRANGSTHMDRSYPAPVYPEHTPPMGGAPSFPYSS